MVNPDRSIDFNALFSIWRADADRLVRGGLIVAFTVILVGSALSAVGPLALKHVVDSLTGRSQITGVEVSLLLAAYVLSRYLSRVAAEARTFVFAKIGRRATRNLTARFFAHVVRLPLKARVEMRTGAVSQILQSGVHGYDLVLYSLFFTIVPVCVELGVITLMLSRLDRPEFLALFGAAALSQLATFIYSGKKNAPRASAAADSAVETNARLTDYIQTYEPVKLFSIETALQVMVERELRRTERQWGHFHRNVLVNGLIAATIFGAFLGTAMVLGVREVQSGTMTLGTLILINAYILQIIAPMEALGMALQMLVEGLALSTKAAVVFRKTPEDLAEDAEPLRGPGRIEFQGVSASYHAGRKVLRDVNFQLSPGKMLGVVGASGCGKSTLVRLLLRLMEPDAGRILLDGIPISQIPLVRLRSAIAVVPQDTALFEDTIAGNIAFGRRESSREEVIQSAKLAGLHDFILTLPEKYETRVGERGVKLSGGEKQRLAIARAVLRKPRIFIFDEATSSLDTHTERQILRNIRELTRHCTTLVVAHRLSSVMNADEIIVLDNGSIIERGTHPALLALKGYYSMLWIGHLPSSVPHDRIIS